MSLTRREFLETSAAAAAWLVAAPACVLSEGAQEMYGLIGAIKAVPGERDALAQLILEGSDDMPGCLSYVVAHDTSDADTIWITEVWDSQASHEASLALPQVRAAIERGRPLIAGFGDRIVTVPRGGHGLVPRDA